MTDFLAAAQRIIAMLLTGSEVTLIAWLSSGGVIYVLRGISFWIDTLIVNFIDSIYSYFMQLLEGTMFNDTIVNALLQNIYVFIGIFIFFRLAIHLMKYIMDPAAVMDEKAGVNSLIKRVIIGLIGILSVPLIFDTALDLQAAVIKDQLIQQIIIPKDMIDATSKKIDNAGKYIGTYVFSGFISPSSKAPEKIKKEYDVALQNGDFSSLNFNSGGFLGVGYTSYDYSYFYLLSTFILGYVLWTMLKYCLDIVVRFFKLLLYQLVAPIAMVEYIINGSSDGVFKNWKNAVLGTYFMLFIRVMSIWFVVLVLTLMSGDFVGYTDQTLLTNNDYLLRALIIVGLLGFMLDLPKLVGHIFGLDLEQESSATGVMKSIGGIVKGLGMGALAVGGAALGGAVGALGGVQKAGLSNAFARAKAIREEKSNLDPSLSRKDARKQAKANVASALHGQNVVAVKTSGTAMKSAAVGMLSGMAGAAVASTAMGKSVQSGYSRVQQHMSSDRQKERQAEEQRTTTEYRRRQIQIAEDSLEAIGNIKARIRVGDVEIEPITLDVKTAAEQARGQAISDVGGYSSNVASSGMNSTDFGRNTTYRSTINNETEIQQRINDVARVHDQYTPSERADYIANSAFANMTNDEFKAHQEGVDRMIKEKKTTTNNDDIETL